jgi:hypothetical protein
MNIPESLEHAYERASESLTVIPAKIVDGAQRAGMLAMGK